MAAIKRYIVTLILPVDFDDVRDKKEGPQPTFQVFRDSPL